MTTRQPPWSDSPFMWGGVASASMFARSSELTQELCLGQYCEERFEGTRRFAQERFGGYCSVHCREDYFSTVGAGDVRDMALMQERGLDTFEEVLYIRTLPSPG